MRNHERLKYRTGVILFLIIVILIVGISALAVYDHATTLTTTESADPAVITITRVVNPTVTTTTTDLCEISEANGYLNLYCLETTTSNVQVSSTSQK